jgi:hypothetical protein
MGGTGFTQEDLDLIEREPTDAETEAEVDAEDAATNAAMLRYGLSPEEIARIRGTTTEEVLRPAPTLRSVERDLAELKELRKSDPRRYWSDETQADEAALIEARERLQGDGEPSAEEDDASGEGDENFGADLPEALKEEWEAEGGIEKNVAAINRRVVLALGELDEAEHDDLLQSFDRDLDDASRVEIARHLAVDHGNQWPSAAPAEVEAFGRLEWGADLVSSWGKQAGKRLGIAKKEADAMLRQLTEKSRLNVERWVAAKSPRQKRAVIEALVARAVQRL